MRTVIDGAEALLSLWAVVESGGTEHLRNAVEAPDSDMLPEAKSHAICRCLVRLGQILPLDSLSRRDCISLWLFREGLVNPATGEEITPRDRLFVAIKKLTLDNARFTGQVVNDYQCSPSTWSKWRKLMPFDFKSESFCDLYSKLSWFEAVHRDFPLLLHPDSPPSTVRPQRMADIAQDPLDADDQKPQQWLRLAMQFDALEVSDAINEAMGPHATWHGFNIEVTDDPQGQYEYLRGRFWEYIDWTKLSLERLIYEAREVPQSWTKPFPGGGLRSVRDLLQLAFTNRRMLADVASEASPTGFASLWRHPDDKFTAEYVEQWSRNFPKCLLAAEEFGVPIPDSLRSLQGNSVASWGRLISVLERHADQTSPQDYFTLKELAAIVRTPESTLGDWKRKGILPPPDIPNRGQSAAKWRWDAVREPLAKQTQLELPKCPVRADYGI